MVAMTSNLHVLQRRKEPLANLEHHGTSEEDRNHPGRDPNGLVDPLESAGHQGEGQRNQGAHQQHATYGPHPEEKNEQKAVGRRMDRAVPEKACGLLLRQRLRGS